MRYLDEQLKNLADSDMYPFHMPGHKRNMNLAMNPYEYDITEIDEFDNLHAPEGIIKEAQERAAKLWGADASFFLVNGSTCGILAAISAAAPRKSRVLIARNCHKAVYHAAYLRELDVSYIYPAYTEFGIQGAVAPKDIEAALDADETIAAVVITSPTYDGVLSDVACIAELVHRHGIPLIVDEAHGAHLGFHAYFPESAVRQGADIVVQSLHKTLPSFTQTAILHVKSDYAAKEEIERFLDVYETSSPSYLFLAGMDRCVRLLQEEGREYFERYTGLLEDFYKKTKNYQYIRVLDGSQLSPREGYAFDASKIVISALAAGLTGKELYDILREHYHLQMEMCQGGYVLAMTSIMDREEGLDRLYQALSDIDHMTQKRGVVPKLQKDDRRMHDFIEKAYGRREQVVSLSQATDADKQNCPLKKSIGRINAEFINLYPPGIPMLVPGERITKETAEMIEQCKKLSLNIQGLSEDNQIKVVIL